MFCYETTRVSVRTDIADFGFDPTRCDATKCYLEHYQNFLTLHWFADHGTIHEKKQANEELEICRRKMKYWERQPHFEHDRAIRAKNELKQKMTL